MELFSDNTRKRNIYCEPCGMFTTHQLYRFGPRMRRGPRCGECGMRAPKHYVEQAEQLRKFAQACVDEFGEINEEMFDFYLTRVTYGGTLVESEHVTTREVLAWIMAS